MTHVVGHYLFKSNIGVPVSILLYLSVGTAIFLQKVHTGNIDKHLISVLHPLHPLHDRLDLSVIRSRAGNKQYLLPLIHLLIHTFFVFVRSYFSSVIP